jgi:CheY-like chemotaxis protein
MGRIMVRILVVEDDALIRAVAIDVLEDAGFAALEAENAMEAISVLDEHAEDIAVLLTDVRMPGRSMASRWRKLQKKLGRGYAQLSPQAVRYRLISPYRKPPSSS